MGNGEYIVVLVTASSNDEATTIARTLLEQKKIACASIVKEVDSFFWWESKLDTAKECLIIMKTRASLLEDVIRTVKKLHTYEVPEIIALPIIGGNPDYLNWIDEALSNT